MNLVIKNEDNLNLDDFCNKIKTLMQNYMQTKLDNAQLIRFDSYLNNNNVILFSNNMSRIISCRNILIGSTYNLKIINTKNLYTIELDPNINIPNTYAKFIDIVKLINYGNFELAPYPIYSEMMQYFADNLKDYYNIYLEGDL